MGRWGVTGGGGCLACTPRHAAALASTETTPRPAAPRPLASWLVACPLILGLTDGRTAGRQAGRQAGTDTARRRACSPPARACRGWRARSPARLHPRPSTASTDDHDHGTTSTTAPPPPRHHHDHGTTTTTAPPPPRHPLQHICRCNNFADATLLQMQHLCRCNTFADATPLQMQHLCRCNTFADATLLRFIVTSDHCQPLPGALPGGGNYARQGGNFAPSGGNSTPDHRPRPPHGVRPAQDRGADHGHGLKLSKSKKQATTKKNRVSRIIYCQRLSPIARGWQWGVAITPNPRRIKHAACPRISTAPAIGSRCSPRWQPLKPLRHKGFLLLYQ